MVHWAQTIGHNTARLFERIMNDKPHPDMVYLSCLGIIRLAGQYSPARMEAAAERALPEREVDSEKLARCRAAGGTSSIVTASAA